MSTELFTELFTLNGNSDEGGVLATRRGEDKTEKNWEGGAAVNSIRKSLREEFGFVFEESRLFDATVGI